MNDSVLPDMSAEEFRRWGHHTIDWIANYLADPEKYPVLAQVELGVIRGQLPASPPEAIFADLERVIVPGLTHGNHPDSFAYFAVRGSGPGILGELFMAAFNVNAMLWKTSPSATELEELVLDWLRQMVGLPEDFMGVVKVAVDDRFRLDVAALEAAIERDLEDGWRPFCVSATIGTTSTTSVDPVHEIAEVCERHGLWLHVDAAYAGSAAILPELRHILDGYERADSFVVNPHKWMFTPIDFSAFYCRRPGVLKQAFSMTPEYRKTAEDDTVTNYMDYGIQLGRRFRALKFWMVVRYFGVDGLRKRIREHIRLGQMFASLIEDSPNFWIGCSGTIQHSVLSALGIRPRERDAARSGERIRQGIPVPHETR